MKANYHNEKVRIIVDPADSTHDYYMRRSTAERARDMGKLQEVQAIGNSWDFYDPKRRYYFLRVE